MPVIRAARSGVRFRGDDGEDRVVLQIGSGAWPVASELRLVATRAIPSVDGAAAGEEEIYVTPDGLRLWARRCAEGSAEKESHRKNAS